MSSKSNTSQLSCRLINFAKNKNLQNEEQSQIQNDYNLMISPRIYHKLGDNIENRSTNRAFAKSSQGYRYQRQFQNKKSIKLKISMITFSSVSDNIKTGKSQEIERQIRHNNESPRKYYPFQPAQAIIKQNSFLQKRNLKKLHTSLHLKKKSPNNVYIPGQSNQQSQMIEYVPTKIFPNRKNSSIIRSRLSYFSTSKSPSQRQTNDKNEQIFIKIAEAKKALVQYVPKKIQNRGVNQKSKLQRNSNFKRNARISMPIDFRKFPNKDNMIQQLKLIHE